MAFVIAAPASGNGKTILSVLLASWARCQGKSIQAFKIGPDYLDPQQLTLITKRPCRNLDPILCGQEWVQDCFDSYSSLVDLTFVEGVMGLFDGLGSSHKGSTSEVANLLRLPILLIVDAKGQAASIAALVKGFREFNKEINIVGVVINNVNTERHKKLLINALEGINIKVFGSLPTISELSLPSKYLGLAPAHEIKNIEEKIKIWNSIAKEFLDIESLEKLLKNTKSQKDIKSKSCLNFKNNLNSENDIVAIAQDEAFHFRYPETTEYLNKAGIKTIEWKITNDEAIPVEAKGIIIPGGFPEQYAEQISNSKRSLSSIRSFFGKKPIYAECGGMLILGQKLYDINNNEFSMANLLPFNAKRGNLSVGYRTLEPIRNSLISNIGEKLCGHEFHKWNISKINVRDLDNIKNQEFDLKQLKTMSPWKMSGWGINTREEGWCSEIFHASWIHLHWPSSNLILKNWIKALKNNNIQS